jgi:transposase
MSGVLKLEIHESGDDLKRLMQQQSEPVARSKVQVLWWLKSGQVTSVDEASELSGYHRVTVSRWLQEYRRGGIAELLEVRKGTGRTRSIPEAVLEDLRQELQDPEGFNGYTEVQRWLYAVHGLKVPYKTVHQTVRYHLQAKLKRGRPVAVQQEPGAVEAFQKNSQS